MSTRTRIRSAVPNLAVCQLTYPSGSSSILMSSNTDIEEEIISDVITPNYRKLVRSGVIVNNPVSYSKRKEFGRGGGLRTAVNQTNGDTYVWEGMVTEYFWGLQSFSNLTYPILDGEADLNKAKLSAIANINPSTFDFGEDFATIRQTIDYLRSPLKGLKRLSREFQRAVKRRRKERPRMSFYEAAADVWLEYRFAFSPLLATASQAVEAINTPISKPPDRRTARGRSNAQDSYDFVVTSDNTYWDFRLKKSRSHEYRTHLIYEGRNLQPSVDRHLGIRPVDFPELAWAVMPYSFMIDRVIDISSVIRALTNLVDPQVVLLAGSITERKEIISSKELIANRNNPDSTVLGTLHASDCPTSSDFTLVRTTWSPTVGDIAPGFNLRGLVSDITKTADLIALILQRMR